jgi:hypothetical protein
MNRKILSHFRKIVIHSMETGQINYLGALLEPSFDVYEESGFGRTIPLPRRLQQKH